MVKKNRMPKRLTTSRFRLMVPIVLLLCCMASAVRSDTQSGPPPEQIVGVKASVPGGSARLLTAPHTGRKICDVADITPVLFLKRADHGPHKFARVEILEGDCAGEQGYLSWDSLNPTPTADTARAGMTYFNATPDGIAIGGYDPVAYLMDHKAARGAPAHALRWAGITWWFASNDNKAQFVAEPGKYAPAYGGWCSMGMAGGQVVNVDFVDGWSVHDGRLHLNADSSINHRWRRAAGRLVEKADGKWPAARKDILEGRATIFQPSSASELYQ